MPVESGFQGYLDICRSIKVRSYCKPVFLEGQYSLLFRGQQSLKKTWRVSGAPAQALEPIAHSEPVKQIAVAVRAIEDAKTSSCMSVGVHRHFKFSGRRLFLRYASQTAGMLRSQPSIPFGRTMTN